MTEWNNWMVIREVFLKSVPAAKSKIIEELLENQRKELEKLVMDDQDYSDGSDPDIRTWFDVGIAKGATHMIIAFDVGYDYEPYYVMPGENVFAKADQLEGGGHLHAIFDLSKPLADKDIHHFYKCVGASV